MRAIGASERALELMCRRANERIAFGSPLADKQFIQDFVAKSRIEIDSARLMMPARGLEDGHGRQAGGAPGDLDDQGASPPTS